MALPNGTILAATVGQRDLSLGRSFGFARRSTVQPIVLSCKRRGGYCASISPTGGYACQTGEMLNIDATNPNRVSLFTLRSGRQPDGTFLNIDANNPNRITLFSIASTPPRANHAEAIPGQSPRSVSRHKRGRCTSRPPKAAVHPPDSQ